MVLNEFYTNPDVYDLAMLGIEGKHWEAVGDDQYKVIDESGYGVASNCNWGWNNCTIQREEYLENRTALDDKYESIKDAFNNNIKEDHVYDGFNFDSSNVSTQFAAVEAAIDNYYNPLRCRQGAPQSPRKVPALFPQTSRKMPAFPVSRCAAGVSRAAGAVGASGAAVPALYHRRLRISPGRGVFPADNERKGGWL